MKRSEENSIENSPRPQYGAVSQAPIRRAEFKEVAAPELDPPRANIAAHCASAIGRSLSGGAKSATGRKWPLTKPAYLYPPHDSRMIRSVGTRSDRLAPAPLASSSLDTISRPALAVSCEMVLSAGLE